MEPPAVLEVWLPASRLGALRRTILSSLQSAASGASVAEQSITGEGSWLTDKEQRYDALMARNEPEQLEQGCELLTVQCRMARAALAWGVRDLAGAAQLSADTVDRFERGKAPRRSTVRAIRIALEKAGCEFICEDSAIVGKLLSPMHAAISRNPLLAIGMALGIGFLLGALTSVRR